MDKENLLKNYFALGINSQENLFNYVVNNTEAVIDERRYNLTKSNEFIEFMAGFLEALNLKVVRLFLSNNKEDEPINHWFLAFNNGFKWFYYEPYLEGIKGEYSFDTFDELVKFAVSKIIGAVEKIDDFNLDIYSNYCLKEIDPLQNFMLGQDVKISKNGNDVIFLNMFNAADDNTIDDSELDGEDIKRQGKFFWLGFIPTLAIGLGLLWYLANFFYGN